MNILNYLEETERRYNFRVKVADLELDNAKLDRIERVIAKYDPIDMSRPRKTIFQARPLDFPKLEGAEVHMVDIGLGMPASPSMLRTELARSLAISEDLIVVRAANDPLEAQGDEAEVLAKFEDDAKKGGMARGSLLANPDYPEGGEVKATDYYGDEYNARFVGYLAKVAREKAEARKVDAPSPLFTWMDMPKGDETPPEVDQAELGRWEPKEMSREKALPPGVAPTGNLDADSRRYARIYKKGGKSSVLHTDVEGVRK